jgi:hypothetical protein
MSVENPFKSPARCAISIFEKKEGHSFQGNGGPKKAIGRGDARWLPLPKKPRHVQFVTEL